MELVFAAAAGVLLGLRLRPSRRAIAIAIIWALLVPLPIAALFVLRWWDGIPLLFDHSGGVIVLMPLGIMLTIWSRVRADRSRDRAHSPRAALALLAAIFVGCLVAERVFGPSLLTVAAAALSMSIAGVAGALCVRVIAGRSAGGAEWFTGALAGLAASATGGPWLTWQWHAVMGIAAGALAALMARRLRRLAPDSGDNARIAAALLLGPIVGAVALGLFAGAIGLVHTGAIELIVEQVRALGFVMIWAFAAAIVLTLIAKPRPSALVDVSTAIENSIR